MNSQSQESRQNYTVKSKGDQVRGTFSYFNRKLVDLRSRFIQLLQVPPADQSTFQKNRARATKFSVGCVAINSVCNIDMKPIIKMLIEYPQMFSDLFFMQVDVQNVRYLYLILAHRQFVAQAHGLEIARAALHFAFQKQNEVQNSSFTSSIGDTLINYNRCDYIKEEPLAKLLIQLATCPPYINDFATIVKRFVSSPDYCALPSRSILKINLDPFYVFAAGSADWSEKDVAIQMIEKVQANTKNTYWSNIKSAQKLVSTTIVDSLLARAQKLLFIKWQQDFNCQDLLTHEALFVNGKFSTHKFPLFLAGFNSDILAMDYMQMFLQADKDEILIEFNETQRVYIDEHCIYEDFSIKFRNKLRADLSAMFASEFAELIAQLKLQYSLSDTLESEAGKSLAYSCMRNFNEIIEADFLPLSVYTVDQFLNFLRISVQVYKWMSKSHGAADANNKQSLVLFGISGSGKSLAPGCMGRYFNFQQMNIHEHFQNAVVVQASGFFSEEYLFSKLIDGQKCSTLKNLTDSNAFLRFEQKGRESKVMVGAPPLILSTNEDPRRPHLLKNSEMPAYYSSVDPLDRRFKLLEYRDTFRSLPLPMRNLSTLHAACALSLLAIGYLICHQDVYVEHEPIVYVSHGGYKSKAPAVVITEAIKERVASSNEPLVYLLKQSSGLCRQIFNAVEAFEQQPDLSIVSKPKVATDFTNGLKNTIVKLFDACAFNQLKVVENVQLVDFRANQTMHPIGIAISQQVGEVSMRTYLKDLPALYKHTHTEDLLSRLSQSTVDIETKRMWVRHSQCWYTMRRYVETQLSDHTAQIREAEQKLAQLKSQQVENIDLVVQAMKQSAQEQSKPEFIEAVFDSSLYNDCMKAEPETVVKKTSFVGRQDFGFEEEQVQDVLALTKYPSQLHQPISNIEQPYSGQLVFPSSAPQRIETDSMNNSIVFKEHRQWYCDEGVDTVKENSVKQTERQIQNENKKKRLTKASLKAQTRDQ